MGLFTRSPDQPEPVGKPLDIEPPRLVRAYNVFPVRTTEFRCQVTSDGACGDLADYIVCVGLGEEIVTSYVCGEHVPQFAGNEQEPMEVLKDCSVDSETDRTAADGTGGDPCR